jgi:hypothetical protein
MFRPCNFAIAVLWPRSEAIGQDSKAASVLELEIIESLIMEDVRLSIGSLRAIRELGVRIAIDDFLHGILFAELLGKAAGAHLENRSLVCDRHGDGPGGTGAGIRDYQARAFNEAECRRRGSGNRRTIATLGLAQLR